MRIGIDLGGHTTVGAVVSCKSDCGAALIERSISRKTPDSRSVEDVVYVIGGIVAELSAGESVSCVGVAIPGMLNRDRTRANILPNFNSEWGRIDVVSAVSSVVGGVPVKIENDANCYALGEGMAGLAVGVKDYVVLTLGTGIGCGIVSDGRILSGAHGMAGEAGHLVVVGNEPCKCGGMGHAETLSGADGTARRAKAAGLPGDFKELWSMRRGQGASKILGVTIDALARTVASISHILDPELIILGGGMSAAPGIAEVVHDAALPYMSNPFKENLNIKVSALGNSAALYGAASLF